MPSQKIRHVFSYRYSDSIVTSQSLTPAIILQTRTSHLTLPRRLCSTSFFYSQFWQWRSWSSDIQQYAAAWLISDPARSQYRFLFKCLAVVTAEHQLLRKNDPTVSSTQPEEEWEKS